jgi:DNA-binding SARP family transcriptional activator
MSSHSRGPTDRLARTARGLGATATLAGALAGVPWLLWQLAGWPLPDHLPSWTETQTVLGRPMDEQFLLNLLACLAWVAWAGFAVETATATVLAVADLRGHPDSAGVLPGLDRRARTGSPLARLAAGLVGAAVLAVAVTRTTPTRLALAPAAATGTTATAPAVDALPTTGTTTSATVAARDRKTGGPTARTGYREYTVSVPRHGVHDSLWRIAEHELGDPRRWTEIYRLNVGRPQPDGARLRDPDLIYPGWVLRLPTTAPPSKAVDPSPPASVTPDPTTATSPPPTTPMTGPFTATSPLATPAPATGAPSSPAHTEEPSATAGPTNPAPGRPATAPAAGPVGNGSGGIDLPSGGYAGLALAASVSAALALARARRRRRDRLDGPLTFRLPLPAPADEQLPPVVHLLHRAHLAATWPDPAEDEHDDPDPEPLASDGAPPANGPARTEARVVLGALGQRPVLVHLTATGGLGLTGPAADGVARALLTTLVTGHAGTGRTVNVLVPRADLDRLLGPGAPADVPGLVPVSDLDAALDHLEARALTVHRTRVTGASGLPITLTALIATPTPRHGHRLAAILHADDVAAVLLDAWPAGLTCHLNPQTALTAVYSAPRAPTREAPNRRARQDPDGSIDLPEDAAAASGARLFHLTPTETRDILRLLADGPSAPPPDPTADPDTHETPAYEHELERGTRQPQAPEPQLPTTPGTGTGPAAATRPPHLRQSTGTLTGPPPGPPATVPAASVTAGPSPGVSPQLPSAVAARPWTAPVRIDLLGPARLHIDGEETGRGTRVKSFELLALLVLNPDGLPGETLADTLWPDADTETARNNLHSTLKRLRATLRGQTGARDAMFVVNASHRYRLDPRLVGSDVWAFHAACHRAEATPEAEARHAALREAADLYRGALLDGAPYVWAEPARAGLHRLALQVLVRLSTTAEATDPEAALATLERALAIDPHNESLYQRAMRLQAALGRPEAIPATLDLLRRHLADLDAHPAPETLALARALQHPDRRASA